MLHVLPSARPRTALIPATLTLSKTERLQVENAQHEGPRSPAAQLLPAAGHQQGLAKLSARCLMAAVLSVSTTSAGASAAAERGEWQPRRHHRRLEPEELREYAQVRRSLVLPSIAALSVHFRPGRSCWCHLYFAATVGLTVPVLTGRTCPACQEGQDSVSIDRTACSSCAASGQLRAVALYSWPCESTARSCPC